MKPINVKEKFLKFNKQWHPHQIATVDDMQVILAKLQGEFVWHSHKDEDELFFVQKGTLEMHFRSKENDVEEFKEWMEIVNEGELIVVPKGVEHCPKSIGEEEVHVLLFEKLATKHTGEVLDEKTQTEYPKI
ncbi:mannose-6-phosphate isomerase [Patiriisocius marinistellae]|uniref:Mannose-6-phosphate isomerase n=1 Tax=Patiriisocius marinistellae TaxID=2494560 RepID=A0A5J4FVI2_9FLAO|nr:cupin domain-containing protein [Patiriisocius marinistellae]GEQ85092.1 mannose-6-phosphate isomerase [Patiriisocius marinistellae]